MSIGDFFGAAGDQGLGWLLVLFVAVVWWGFRPWFQGRKRPKPGEDGRDD
ncbi:MAG: hypothetical protein OEZ19_11330 [Paracoccaceae bacterium]|nr:hypothetical protein [Paracoccaceae bacterium]